MIVKKRVIGELDKCYSLAMLKYQGKEHFLVAAEKVDKCFLYDLDGNQEETVWEEPGRGYDHGAGSRDGRPVPGYPEVLFS